MSSDGPISVTVRLEPDAGCWYVTGGRPGPAGLVDLPLTEDVQLAVDAAEPDRLVELAVALPGSDPAASPPPETLALVAALLGEDLAAQLSQPAGEPPVEIQVECQPTAALRAVGWLALLQDLRAAADAPSPWWAAEAAVLAQRVGTPEFTAYARNEARQAAPALAALAHVPGEWWKGWSGAVVRRLEQLAGSVRGLLVDQRAPLDEDDVEDWTRALTLLLERLRSAAAEALPETAQVEDAVWLDALPSEWAPLSSDLLDSPVPLPASDAEHDAERDRAGFPVPVWAFREQIAPRAYCRLLAAATVVVAGSPPASVQITVPLQAGTRPDRLEGLFFRVFDVETGALLGAAELQHDKGNPTGSEPRLDSSALARVVLPRSFVVNGRSRTPGRLEIDLTSQPRTPPAPRHRRRRRTALRAGFLAVRADRLGHRGAAEQRWLECARLWHELGEHAQGARAEALAAAAAANPPDTAAGAPKARWFAGECLPLVLDAWARQRLASAERIRAEDPPAAMQLARMVIRVLEPGSPRMPLADARLMLAGLLADQGGNLAAREQLRRAQGLYGRLAHCVGLDDCRGLLAELDAGQAGGQGRRPAGERATGRSAGIVDLYALGVSLGQDQLVGVLVDGEGRVLDVQCQPLAGRTPAEVAGEVAMLAKELVRAGSEFDEHVAAKVIGLGVELGGLVDHETGDVLFYAPATADPGQGLPSEEEIWRKVPLAPLVEQMTGFDTVLENDANALAVFEHSFGQGDVAHFAVLLLGEGIGCGLVLNNGLYRGARGIAGEIGHTVVPRGRSCVSCDRDGCLDSVASVRSILAIIGKAKGQPPLADLDSAIKLLREGDKLAFEAFDDAGDALAHATADVLNVHNPARVILRAPGSMLEQENPFIQAFKVSTKAYRFSRVPDDCELILQPLRLTDGARGVAAVAFQRFEDSP